MERYSNAKIYMIEPICEHEEDEVYIGSTCKKYLSQRFSMHKSDYKKWQQGKDRNISSYRLFEKYGFENCRIVLLEECLCENKNQLLAREAHYQKSMKCINTNIAFRSNYEKKEQKKIYSEKHKEHIEEYQKKYREDNKEEIKEQKKNYYEEHKEEISIKRKNIYEENKEEILEQKKNYYQENKETFFIKNKKYYEEHREEMLKKAKETMECICGSISVIQQYKRHCKTKKHQRYIEENQIKEDY